MPCRKSAVAFSFGTSGSPRPDDVFGGAAAKTHIPSAPRCEKVAPPMVAAPTTGEPQRRSQGTHAQSGINLLEAMKRRRFRPSKSSRRTGVALQGPSRTASKFAPRSSFVVHHDNNASHPCLESQAGRGHGALVFVGRCASHGDKRSPGVSFNCPKTAEGLSSGHRASKREEWVPTIPHCTLTASRLCDKSGLSRETVASENSTAWCFSVCSQVRE